ncbi:hypothetical protein IWW37_001381 [Coemansia sp. RSA 2050]|nr:hypothetical protein IWW37_001381 [Coemansia sp. RSA 2050]KAJ2734942.1 hypothetical protein IW152_001924 [Coemansia sp. BCRC 34962]
MDYLSKPAQLTGRPIKNSLDTLAVAVAKASTLSGISEECDQVSLVAPQIPESLIVATKIRRGRPKHAEHSQPSQAKMAALNEGYQRIVSQIAHDASEDNGGRRRQFVCTVSGCGKIFYQRAHLNIHIRSHTGYKPYACPYPGCGKSFPQLGNMRTHERTHTGDRPFKCELPECQRAFTQLGNLKTHMKKVHNVAMSPKSRRASRGSELPPSQISPAALLTAAAAAYGTGPIVNIGDSSAVVVNRQQLHSNILPASVLANAKLSRYQKS